MQPKTPEELENLKLETFLKNQPSFLAKMLGSLKKGVKEKLSQKKSDSSRINAQKARDAKKARLDAVLKNESNE